MRISAYMLSCAERSSVRDETLTLLQSTDWKTSVEVVVDKALVERRQERQEQTALTLLLKAVADDPDMILFLEDDLEFNTWLRYNLERWRPLRWWRRGHHFFGSLYNPNIGSRSSDPVNAFFIAEPQAVYGSQAFVLATSTARYIAEHWAEVPGMQDIKMSRLAAQVGPLHYHRPSLVQHRRVCSAWGGPYHWAADFDSNWRAP